MSESLEFNLLEDETRECPFKYFEAIRHLDKPVYFMPELGAYYVSRYEDVRFIKKHPEIFSNDIYKHGSQRGGTSRNVAEEFKNENGWARVSTLQRTDPPVHTKYRGLINDAFSVARIRNMTNYIETVVNDLIDKFIDEGKCDFMWDFSVPLPCTVIADQLGVPREKIWQLKRWSDAMLAPGGGFTDEAQALECAKQVVEAQQFFAEVLGERKHEPKDDIISDLAHAKLKDDLDGPERELDMFELQDLLDQLLTGGNETTTNAIGSGLMLLLQRPELMDRMRSDQKLIRNFIEESLRYETPVLHLWRVAVEDTELGGIAIPKGSSIAVGYASANRDEAVFDDSETFDIERKKAGAHLAFGSGPHHCPGAALARQEMYSAFTIFLHRLDNIRAVDRNEPFKHVPSSFLRGLSNLHLEFDVRQRDRYFPNASVY
ncbi:MAG: cytochrome P450 [Gammaproteobacteria bacterium]|jgi:cytochrome P450|nr:cytochrome P450 [Gammaproteobacteria bacterium]MBT4377945.1 cytochrome P450 [Gammaproteobacteria bacterium]MBT5444689.1 cytochrome P450 [Gammaproteobacteria bacterium]MBT5788850.1 cytochrome P450 [Gammaproteobacteria bacterium]MBT6569656.1 cytochrome P450 [Gammaproteobacteria bacterium]